MNAIKQWFSNAWDKIFVIGVLVVAALAWIIDLLSKKNDALQAQVQDVKDQKAADVLESKINAELADSSLKQKQVDSNQTALQQLEEKRQELPKQKDLSSQQIENYWKDNK